MRRLLIFGLSLVYWGLIAAVVGALVVISLPKRETPIDLPDRPIAAIRADQTPRLRAALTQAGLTFGAPVYLRIFKQEAELELWVQAGATYQLFKTYPICRFSGALGPKLREGDHQAPEGFYQVTSGALNPHSRFHLSFNLGFPNAFDRAHGRTGSFLMVHGACVSVGCYAMTDPAIEEIYVLVEAALRGGQGAVPVHAFPFRMERARLRAAQNHRWAAFWQQLAPAYTSFESTRRVPRIGLTGQTYDVVGG